MLHHTEGTAWHATLCCREKQNSVHQVAEAKHSEHVVDAYGLLQIKGGELSGYKIWQERKFLHTA